MSNIPEHVEIGDFFVTTGGPRIGPIISFFEQIDKEDIPGKYLTAATQFQHAGLVSEIRPATDGDDKIVMLLEEGGNGMVETPYHYQNAMILWSTGVLVPSNRQAVVARARQLKGHKYGWLTYAALTAHHYHINVPGLKGYIASSSDEICSQSVDDAWEYGGNHIFDDGRWPGDVKPSDLAYRLLEAGAKPLWP